MSRITVRPPFFLPSSNEPQSPADPLATTVADRELTGACSLLVGALRESGRWPEDLLARAKAARTLDEVEAVLADLAHWSEGGRAPAA